MYRTRKRAVKAGGFHTLPQELLYAVLSFSTALDMHRVRNTCRGWKHGRAAWTAISNVHSDKAFQGMIGMCFPFEIVSVSVANCNVGGVTDQGLALFRALGPLTKVNIGRCSNVTDAGVKSVLAHSATLTSLDLADLPLLTQSSFDRVGTLPRLTKLSTGWSRNFTGASLAAIAKCSALRDLNLKGCKLYDSDLQGLPKHLHTLTLSMSFNIMGSGLVHVGALVHLRKLDLSFSYITGADLAHLVSLALENLRIDHCRRINDAGFVHIAALATLQRLSMQNCTQVTNAGLGLLTSLPALRELDLSYNSQFTDGGFIHLAAMKSLKWISVTSTNISGQTLEHVVDELALDKLEMNMCPLVGSDVKQRIRA